MESQSNEKSEEEKIGPDMDGVWPPTPVDTNSSQIMPRQNVIDVARINRLARYIAAVLLAVLVLVFGMASLSLLRAVFYWTLQYELSRQLIQPLYVLHNIYYVAFVCELLANGFWFFCAYSNLSLLSPMKQKYAPWLAAALFAMPIVNVAVFYLFARELWSGSLSDNRPMSVVEARFIGAFYGLVVFSAVYNIASIIIFRVMATHYTPNLYWIYLAYVLAGDAMACPVTLMNWIGVRCVTEEQIRKGQEVARA